MPGDDRPHRLIERARAYAREESATADEIRQRFEGGIPAGQIATPAAEAVSRSAGQAVAVAHMGAHALGAAAYAAEAVALANPDRPGTSDDEIKWQLDHMTPQVRVALASLPVLRTNRSGPLGPGLLTTGQRGDYIARIQVEIGGNTS